MDMVSYMLVSLAFGIGKIMEQIHLEGISRHIKNEKVNGNSQSEISRENHIWLKCGKPSHIIGADRTITAVLVGYGLHKCLVQWVKFGYIIKLEW